MPTRVMPVVTSVAALTIGLSAQDTARPTADWPGLWGPSRNAVASALASPPRSAKNLWHRASQGGYSEVAIAGQRIITMDLRNGVDHVVALDAETGKDIWATPIGPTYRGHDGSEDGPIATPTIDGADVFAVGHGVIAALDLKTGRERWRHDLRTAFGVEIPGWGFAASPLVEGQLVILAGGGAKSHGLLAFDRSSGRLRWSALPGLSAGYSSAVAATVAGTRQVIVVRNRVAAVSPDDGRELWSAPALKGNEEILNSALVLPNDRVLLTHANEAWLLRIVRQHDHLVAEEIWRSPRVRISMSPAVHVNGSLYAFSGGQLSCIDPATGETRWRERTGDGTLAAAGTTLFLVTRSGDLIIAAASPDGYREASRTRVFSSGGSTVTGPSLAGGRLYVRSTKEIAAFVLGS